MSTQETFYMSPPFVPEPAEPWRSPGQPGAVLLAEDPGREGVSIFNSCSAEHLSSLVRHVGPVCRDLREGSPGGCHSLGRASVPTGWVPCTHVLGSQHRGRLFPPQLVLEPRGQSEAWMIITTSL